MLRHRHSLRYRRGKTGYLSSGDEGEAMTMSAGSSVAHRVVVLGNDAECRCDKILSPWGGRTTHLRSQCSPETVTESEFGVEITKAA
jgi:hypothetical protein